VSPLPDLELTLPARAENVAVVRHIIAGVGDALGIEDAILDDIRLAVSEACTNVVVHAYPSGEGLLTVSVDGSYDEVLVAVCDSGRGMAPRPDSPGLGVGLPLIASLASLLELGAAPGGGTEVRMRFALTGDEHDLSGAGTAGP
jgi:anti-sigma regulatory factor (Ser/Thr protein kinase)